MNMCQFDPFFPIFNFVVVVVVVAVVASWRPQPKEISHQFCVTGPLPIAQRLKPLPPGESCKFPYFLV